jgi:anaerobic dimethyl sulfoxide reductase subunit B (iron-sulfur subunit)
LKTRYGFYFDTDRCIKCKSCEIACKQWKGLPAGSFKLRRVEEVTRGVFPDVSRRFYSISCRHCAKAPCIGVCPTQAIYQRPDGIVLVDQDKCNGCRVCLEACQFGAPQFDDNGLMQKCDMCLDRIENGQIPACAASCPTQALSWGTTEELANVAARKAVFKIAAE